MKVAASAISATESTSPAAMMQGWSRAAPATASTLSSDIETSATRICHIASPSVLVEFDRDLAFGRSLRQRLGPGVLGGALPDLAEELPADPEQQDAAGEEQADDLQKLHGEQRQEHAQDDRAADPVEDHLAGGSRAARPAAAMPTTMALSPDSTTLMKITCRMAESSDESSIVPSP